MKEKEIRLSVPVLQDRCWTNNVQCILHNSLLGLLAREGEIPGQHARRAGTGMGLNLSGLVVGRGGDGSGGDTEGYESCGWLGCWGTHLLVSTIYSDFLN